METAGIEPASAIASMWLLRAYPALWSHPSLASPAGLRGTSLLECSRFGEDGPRRVSPLSDPGLPHRGQVGPETSRLALN